MTRQQEPQFAKEFVQRDGLGQLMAIIGTNHGNTLAVRLFFSQARKMTALLSPRHQYALTAMRNLMDYDYGWATIETSFIAQVCGTC
jgi:engulfment/cell motility protein 1